MSFLYPVTGEVIRPMASPLYHFRITKFNNRASFASKSLATPAEDLTLLPVVMSGTIVVKSQYYLHDDFTQNITSCPSEETSNLWVNILYLWHHRIKRKRCCYVIRSPRGASVRFSQYMSSNSDVCPKLYAMSLYIGPTLCDITMKFCLSLFSLYERYLCNPENTARKVLSWENLKWKIEGGHSSSFHEMQKLVKHGEIENSRLLLNIKMYHMKSKRTHPSYSYPFWMHLVYTFPTAKHCVVHDRNFN